MRVVVQLKSSQVAVNGQVVGKIGQGLNLLVGIADTDTAAEAEQALWKSPELPQAFP